MKKLIVLIIPFSLFFAVVGFFIWQQNKTTQYTNKAPVLSDSITILKDTITTKQQPYDYAQLSGDSLHLYSLPILSDSTLQSVIAKNDLDRYNINYSPYETFEYYCIHLVKHIEGWHQTADSLWVPEKDLRFMAQEQLLPPDLQDISQTIYNIFYANQNGLIDVWSTSWISPNKLYILTLKYYGSSGINDSTLIIDTTGNKLFMVKNHFTSPAWYKNYVFVRGMWDDDAVYKIDLANNKLTIFFQIPEKYSKNKPDYGMSDGFSPWPAVVIDTTAEIITIRFERHFSNLKNKRPRYDSYLVATTDLSGKLLEMKEIHWEN